MWLYHNKPFTSDNIINELMYAFTYIIENTQNGKKYVGKKVLFSKKTLPPLKGKVRKRIVIKESNWEKYWSSCKPLLDEIAEIGTDHFTRTIIDIFPNKTEANYAELKFQIINNVLDAVDDNGDKLWYNENISRIFYPTNKYRHQRNFIHAQMIKTYVFQD